MRRTVPPAVGGDRGAERRVCSPWGWAKTRGSRRLSRRSSGPVDHPAGGRGGVRGVARAGALSAPAGLSARSAQRLSPAPGADRGGRACGRDAGGPPGGRAVCVQALPTRHQAAAHRAVAGDGDRRVRARPIDARRRAAVRAGRAGEAVQVDRRPGSAASCASALRRSSAATSTASSTGIIRACMGRRWWDVNMRWA